MKIKEAIKKTSGLIAFVLILFMGVLGLLLYSKTGSISIASSNPQTILEVELNKYINFDGEQGKGTLIEYGVKTAIEYNEQDEYKPVKNSTVTLAMPQINGVYPEKVTVITVSTKSTNGSDVGQDTKYVYDQENGTVTIQATNENENGEAKYTEMIAGAQDEYEVICSYGEQAYTAEKEERDLIIEAKAVQYTYSEENNMGEESKTFEAKLTENKGDLLSVENDVEDIYNGYIKSNIINGTKYNTEFKQTDRVVVSQKEAQDKLQLQDTNGFVKIYKDENGTEQKESVSSNGNLVITSTKLIKEEITRLLGEDGIIQILDSDKNVIAEINKDTEFAEDGTLTINYEKQPETIYIKTSNIQNEGVLNIENTKQIKNTFTDWETLKINISNTITGINEKTETIEKTDEEGNVVKEEKVTEEAVSKKNNENVLTIKDAKTNISVDVSQQEWTNEKQNDVTFDIGLKANSSQDNMFKNPTIKIELPSEVEKVILGDSNLTYANGLKLEAPYVEENDGTYYIVANLKGTQTEYNENELNLATTINIPATIILKKDITNAEEKINVNYANEYSLSGEQEKGTIEKVVKVVNFQESTKVQATSQSVFAQTTNETATAQSSTSSEIADGLTLEVVPVKGDTTLQDGDTIYEGEFIKYNIKVTNTSEEKIENIAVKGSIPEGVTYGELNVDYTIYNSQYEYNFNGELREKEINIGTLNAGQTYETYYEVKVNDLAEGVEQLEITSDVKVYVGETENNKYQIQNIIKPAEVKVFVSSSLYNTKDNYYYDVLVEGDYDKEVTIQLKTDEIWELEYIVSEFEVLEDKDYSVSEDNIITFKAYTGKLYTLQGTTNKNKISNKTSDGTYEILAIATASTKDFEYKSNENRILYKYENLEVTMTSSNEGEEVKVDEEINYEITVKNTGGINIPKEECSSTSFNIKDYLPNNLELNSLSYENYKEVGVTIDEETGEYKGTGQYEKTTQTETLDRKTDSDENQLPELDLDLVVPFGESITIKISATAGMTFEKIQINNIVNISGDTIDSKASNIVSHTILPYNYVETNNPADTDDQNDSNNTDNTDDQNDSNSTDNTDDSNNLNNSSDSKDKYQISGIVWLDSDQNGEREDNEELLSEITVMLVDLDNSSEIMAKTTTNEGGQYNFTEVVEGNYIVIFKYDTNTYALTKYQVQGAKDNINSDANGQKITLDGKEVYVGVTDTINVSKNINNIDCGLVKNEGCNLKLDKYITKITVKTSEGTKTQEYKNSQFAKTEIKAKQIEGAIVTIEYNITVKNEGKISTIVSEVTDYIPDGFEYEYSSKNNWKTQGKECLVYSSGKELGAGESIQIPLVLTKTMTSESTGSFVNKAEISSYTNLLSIQDSDLSDNSSEAEALISVSTGLVIYITFAIVVIILLTLIGYAIYKFGFVNTKKILLFMIIATMVVGTNVESFAYSYAASYTAVEEGEHYEAGTFYGGDGAYNGYCVNHGLPAAGVYKGSDGKYHSRNWRKNIWV